MVDLGPLTPSVQGTAQARLSAAVRSLIGEVTSGVFDEAALTDAADRVETVVGALSAAASGPRTRDAHSTERYQLGNPVSGALNPLAAPLALETVEGADGKSREVRGAVNFAKYYEGPPGLVHGGYVAAVLDEALGIANYVAEAGALTGTLTVRYRKPTPLRADLRVEARYLRTEGRKIHTWAGLFRDDELLAEADGLFIAISPEMFARMSRETQ